QLGIGGGLLEIAIRFLEAPRSERRPPGPVIALGLDLERTPSAGIIVEHRHRAARLADAIQRDHPAEPDEAGVIVADADWLLADVGAGGKCVAQAPGDV